MTAQVFFDGAKSKKQHLPFLVFSRLSLQGLHMNLFLRESDLKQTLQIHIALHSYYIDQTEIWPFNTKGGKLLQENWGHCLVWSSHSYSWLKPGVYFTHNATLLLKVMCRFGCVTLVVANVVLREYPRHKSGYRLKYLDDDWQTKNQCYLFFYLILHTNWRS